MGFSSNICRFSVGINHLLETEIIIALMSETNLLLNLEKFQCEVNRAVKLQHICFSVTKHMSHFNPATGEVFTQKPPDTT